MTLTTLCHRVYTSPHIYFWSHDDIQESENFILNSISDLLSAKIYQWSFWCFDVHVLLEFATANIFLDNVDNSKVKNYLGNETRSPSVFDTRRRIESEKLN